MKFDLRRIRFGFDPPLSRFEVGVIILTSIFMLIAGYNYGRLILPH